MRRYPILSRVDRHVNQSDRPLARGLLEPARQLDHWLVRARMTNYRANSWLNAAISRGPAAGAANTTALEEWDLLGLAAANNVPDSMLISKDSRDDLDFVLQIYPRSALHSILMAAEERAINLRDFEVRLLHACMSAGPQAARDVILVPDESRLKLQQAMDELVTFIQENFPISEFKGGGRFRREH